MTVHGRIAFFLIAFLALPLSAQQAPNDDRIQQLEQRLDELLRQAGEIRNELQQLKGTAAGSTPAATTESDDLMNVGVVGSAATPAAPQSSDTPAPTGEQPQTALTDVSTIQNQQPAGSSKVFNPDMSVIGNFVGRAGQRNPYEFGEDELRPSLQLEEAEVALEAFVDPYAKGKFFLAAGPEGLEIEEGFIQFLTLPHQLTAKVGKEKATFGKANTWHTHVRPWADQPLVIHNFFGDEGLADSGISVSKPIANPWNAYLEVTGEVFRGDVENVFSVRNQNDLFYNGHLKFFKDLSENSNLEVGTSIARGTLANAVDLSGSAASRFGGIDVTYRWKPLQQGIYRGFIGRFEGIANDRDDLERRLYGWYASGDLQFAQRWFAGVRLDSAGRGVFGEDGSAFGTERGRGISATLTFWPSEFSQIRTQLRRTSYGGAETVNEILLQLQFAIGAHGAHTF